jgi:hypothetical protein
MNKISKGLKTLFLVHLVVGLIFGLIQLLIPATFFGWFGVSVPDVWPSRFAAAAVLAFSASSWFCYKAAVWDEVKIVVKTEIVWTVLATLVILFGLFFEEQPTASWINAIIMAGFAAAFIYFYIKEGR